MNESFFQKAEQICKLLSETPTSYLLKSLAVMITKDWSTFNIAEARFYFKTRNQVDCWICNMHGRKSIPKLIFCHLKVKKNRYFGLNSPLNWWKETNPFVNFARPATILLKKKKRTSPAIHTPSGNISIIHCDCVVVPLLWTYEGYIFIYIRLTFKCKT